MAKKEITSSDLDRNLSSGQWVIHEVKPKDKAKLKHELYNIFHVVYDENDEIVKHWYV